MNHGGKRKGAGRPSGSNMYGEATQPIRIPLSRIPAVKALIEKDNYTTVYTPAHEDGEQIFNKVHRVLHKSYPLYSSTVPAGFPSPADDYVECRLDLNTHLIKNTAATFFVKASGDSMKNAGIHSGDMLIVDRSLEATHGKIVIAAIDGELTVKRLSRKQGKVKLLPENPDYPPIDITDEQNLVIWGVVTNVIHRV